MLLRTSSGRPLLKRLLDPSARTLFAVAFLAFTGALYYGYPHAVFLVRGSSGSAEIVEALPADGGSARYRVRLQDHIEPAPVGVVESDRYGIEPGQVISVFYRRDHPASMLAVELFAPWARSIWLAIVALAAFGLGMRERARPPKEDGDGTAAQASGPATRAARRARARKRASRR